MMQVITKSHEDRIATLEQQVADLKRIVGTPVGGLGGLGGLVHGANPMSQAAAAQALRQAQQAVGGSTANTLYQQAEAP